MGGELGKEEVDPPPTYNEQFERVFPWYLSIGMPAHEFWQGDPALAIGYRKAHELYIERKNQEQWMQGLYFFRALNAAIHGEKNPYPDMPMPLDEKQSREQEAIRQKRADREAELSMESFMLGVNAKYKNKEG